MLERAIAPWNQPGHSCSALDGDGPPCRDCRAYFKARENIAAGLRAAWRQRRVQTDRDMSVLLDSWEEHGGNASSAMFEIADASDGRITIETSEQLASPTLILAVFARENERVGTSEPPIYRTDRQVLRYLGSAPAKIPVAVHDEMSIECDPIEVEFEGDARVGQLYGSRGELLVEFLFDTMYRLRKGDTFTVQGKCNSEMLYIADRQASKPANFGRPSIGEHVFVNPPYDMPTWSDSYEPGDPF